MKKCLKYIVRLSDTHFGILNMFHGMETFLPLKYMQAAKMISHNEVIGHPKKK